MNTVGLLSWLIVGSIGTLLFLATLIFFGKLMKLQMKIWFLAKKGFHLIEHVGTNKVRTYFYLKPNDNKFDFKSGFYLHYPEATTKVRGVMPNTPSGFKRLDQMSEVEGAKLQETVGKLIYDTSAVSLRWGIPIITYVGNSPYPVNFTEPEKEYGAQVIRDVYIRLLATEQYGFMKKIITIGMIILGVIAVALILIYFGYRSQAGNTAMCMANWNSTAQSLINCINQTAEHVAANMPIGRV